MGIVLRKPGSAPAKVIPASPPSVGGDYKSPFKESFHDEALKSLPTAIPQATVDPPKPVGNKPKAVIRIGGGKPVRPGLPPSVVRARTEADDLIAAGLASPTPEPKELTSRELYPPVMPGEHVRVTNTLFPWVKHYKPGDIGRVLYSSPTHSHPEDPYKYRAYFLEIVSDGPTKGQKPMLFRWEFEPRRDATPPPRIEGRVITQT